MIITKLMGGTGNQMFQYAAGLALAQKHNTELLLDINYLLDKSTRYFKHKNRDYTLDMFNISAKVASNQQIFHFTVPRKGNKYIYHFKKKVFPAHNVFYENELLSFENLMSLPSDSYIEGSWQTTKYFQKIEEQLRIEFSFKKNLPNFCTPLLTEIRNGNSICMMFRRGDFINHPILDVVKLDFYYAALKLIYEQVANPKLFIFSDDISWCKENFISENFELEFVDQSLSGPNDEYHFQMITNCKHFIIPNSTFAWWGAWLSNSVNKIVIAPKKWFNGQTESINSIVLPEWICI